ncbi:MAG: UPF0182 family protein, partial [Candidatus Acidiferrum sp.]
MMSENIERERIHISSGGPFPPARRSHKLFLLVLAFLFVLVISGQTWVSYYVDALWFGSLGYREVFWKTLRLEWAVFAGFAVVTFLIVYGSILALKRAHRDDLHTGQTILVGRQALHLPVEPILRLAAVVVSLLIALGTGAFMMGQWPTLALYWYAPIENGGITDPLFGKPVSFYLLKLPTWQLISGWLMFLAVLVCVLAALFFVVANSTRAIGGFRRGYAGLPWRGLSISIAFLLLVIALQVYIGRFALLFQDHTIFG